MDIKEIKLAYKRLEQEEKENTKRASAIWEEQTRLNRQAGKIMLAKLKSPKIGELVHVAKGAKSWREAFDAVIDNIEYALDCGYIFRVYRILTNGFLSKSWENIEQKLITPTGKMRTDKNVEKIIKMEAELARLKGEGNGNKT